MQTGKQMEMRSYLSLLVLLITATACTVQLVSNYDEKTDEAITKLQKDVTEFLVTVGDQYGSPACAHAQHKKFYQDTKVAISSIEVRANAIPKNSITTQQVGILKNNIDLLETLHKSGCFKSGQVSALQSSFDSGITAILKLELAKKRGK